MDLSKAYDFQHHDLSNSKVEAYGFDNISLKLFRSYFSNRKQRVKIGLAINEWIGILTRIPEGSILGPLIFIFLLTISLCLLNNALYKSSPSVLIVLNCLEHNIEIALNCFKVNSLKPNPPKISVY